MRHTLAIILIAVGCGQALRAQDCTPSRQGWLATGVVGQEIVPDSRTPAERTSGGGSWPQDTTTNVVPLNEVWLVKSATIGQSGAGNGQWSARQYSIAIQRFWNTDPAAISAWTGGLKECVNTVTPLCSVTWERGFLLEPNDRLVARASGNPEGAIYIMSFGWRLPLACRARILGLDSPAVAAGTAVLPDYSAMAAAATAAASSLTTLAASVPR